MSTTFKTPKGTDLELIKLKGKDYMLVAQRLIWFNEEVKNYDIETNFLVLTDDQTVCRTTVKVYDENRNLVRQATATKRETKKDFPDHTEKAESSSLGRALSMLSFGTAQALADFDEGLRLADAPLEPNSISRSNNGSHTPSPKPSFNKKNKPVVTQEVVDGWE